MGTSFQIKFELIKWKLTKDLWIPAKCKSECDLHWVEWPPYHQMNAIKNNNSGTYECECVLAFIKLTSA